MNPPSRPSSLTLPQGYADWLVEINGEIVQVRPVGLGLRTRPTKPDLVEGPLE